MPTQQETADVILDGAMRALARHGTSRLSMTDICREARVSRGTLYRYFANREDVLDAMNRRIMGTMRATFDEAISREPDPQRRLRVMLRAMIRFPDRFPHMKSVVEHEPGAAMSFITRELPVLVEVITEYLMPAYEQAPPVRDGVVTPEELSEIFQRLITSTFLIPSEGSEQLDGRIADLWESFMQASSPPAPAAPRPRTRARV
ncbi:MAG: TetR/AcrR family transcriptional regulator [Frankiales bacterium]|nr:TetR/AcrR family transcriptional regulator [Frankiales bacterium]